MYAILPTSPEFVASYPAGEQDYSAGTEHIRKLAAEQDCALFDGSEGFTEQQDFADIAHLNEVGKRAFTSRLTETVRQTEEVRRALTV
jgi:hypothetical protein